VVGRALARPLHRGASLRVTAGNAVDGPSSHGTLDLAVHMQLATRNTLASAGAAPQFLPPPGYLRPRWSETH
jgi:hypothetical protein